MSAPLRQRFVDLPQVTLSILEPDGEPSGPAVVLCHGFPELAYSWRHQLTALGAAGYGAVAPNQRGYERSSAPREIEAYDLDHLTDDLAHLLDALDIDRAVFVGHDWGGFVAWAMPLRHPDRCLGVVGVNTPYMKFPPTPLLRGAFPDPEKLYILWFQEPGVAEAVLDAKPRAVFERVMRRGQPRKVGKLIEMENANPFLDLDAPADGEPLLDEAELEVFVESYSHSGFRGPINWYRNVDRNAELLPELGETPLDLPCLQITAAWDGALPPDLAARTRAKCSDLEVHDLECGHWTQQEKPEELNAILIDWLGRRFPV